MPAPIIENPVTEEQPQTFVNPAAPQEQPGSTNQDVKAVITIVEPEVPGDLGNLESELSYKVLMEKALLLLAMSDTLKPINHRYRGHRESTKFNFYQQKILCICGALSNLIRTKFNNLYTVELTQLYPTDSEISQLYHIREQMKFREWSLLKDQSSKWFV